MHALRHHAHHTRIHATTHIYIYPTHPPTHHLVHRLPGAMQGDMGSSFVAAAKRDKPTQCPGSVSSFGGTAGTTAPCSVAGGSGTLVLDIDSVCGAPATTLYLWVAVSAGYRVSARLPACLPAWNDTATCACTCAG